MEKEAGREEKSSTYSRGGRTSSPSRYNQGTSTCIYRIPSTTDLHGLKLLLLVCITSLSIIITRWSILPYLLALYGKLKLRYNIWIGN